MEKEYGQNKYTEIKNYINDFNYSYEDKFKINKLMEHIIPILKEVYKVNNINRDPYISGMQEAWVNTIRISVRTVNKNKILSLIFDINSYVNYYLSNKNELKSCV